MTNFRVSFLALGLLLACTPERTPQQQAFLEELANRQVTCAESDDCDAQWNRAIAWVSKHTRAGIRMVNANLISANMVKDGSRPPNKYPEFTVVRRKTQGQGYFIDFDSYCEHGFVCTPSALELRASFVTSVMGPPPGVTLSEHGNRASKIIHSEGE